MNKSEERMLEWKRDSQLLTWQDKAIEAPGKVLWASLLPSKEGFGVVTLFDETTPLEDTNGFVYQANEGFRSVKVVKERRLVRFLGCYSEGELLVFNAANDVEYLIDPETLEVRSTRYYR